MASLLLILMAATVGASAAVCTHNHPAGVHKLEVEGRNFLLLVPNRLDRTRPAPIVYDVPGFSESPYYQMELTSIRDQLEIYGWIAAIPFGTAAKPTSTCCPASASAADCEAGRTLDKDNACSFNAGACCGVAQQQRIDDVAFARAVLAYLEANMCGSTTDRFATGFSNGGMMSNRLGCDAADVFKAVAPVAGNLQLGGDLSACNPARPVGWISLCGDRDSACNFNFDETATAWAKRNGCTDGDPVPSYSTSTTNCLRYTGCSSRTEFCTIVGLAHEWPGHLRPDGSSPVQPDSNIDGTAFIFDRFAAMVGDVIAGTNTTRNSTH